MRVESRPALVEDVRWIGSQVAFATLQVIGSNNGLAPWTGLGRAAPTPLQAAEVDARIGPVLAWVDATFDVAEASGLKGVVLAMQADTWSPTPAIAQQAIVSRIATRTAVFGGQVLLVQGDSDQFVADDPLGLPNFTRIVVHGETLPFEYFRLTVDPRAAPLFGWERVPVHAPLLLAGGSGISPVRLSPARPPAYGSPTTSRTPVARIHLLGPVGGTGFTEVARWRLAFDRDRIRASGGDRRHWPRAPRCWYLVRCRSQERRRCALRRSTSTSAAFVGGRIATCSGEYSTSFTPTSPSRYRRNLR